MKDSLAELLEETVVPEAVSLDNKIEIGIDEFLENIVPKANSISALVENKHLSNFVSVTAPQDEAEQLFKWKSNFAWSYDGDVADSIKQRVKKAGGNVSTKFRVSLGWFNTDDLDIHVVEPNGRHIYYGNQCGVLDVDMNASSYVRDAVENLCWSKMKDGVYRIHVHNYAKRENIDIGFVIETEFSGKVETYSYNKAVANGAKVPVIDLIIKNGEVAEVKISKDLISGSMSENKWGIKTQTLAPIDTIMLSPNYWNGDSTGNKHWFFVLRDCKNPDKVRGFYNEFLDDRLNKHRKVFEVLGSKNRCEFSEDQLSGVGFSSTKRSNLSVVVHSDNSNLSYDIKF